MHYIDVAGLRVSRFTLGSNPFSGFSHQNVELDQRMIHHYTSARIKDLLRAAEKLGINTLIARADHHIRRLLLEYWDEGGTLQWIAQTCPELGPPENAIHAAVATGAKAIYIHGGVMDYHFAQNKLDLVPGWIKLIRDAGRPAGIAAHNPRVIEWAEKHLDVDFYLCCYYNPTARDKIPQHVHGAVEWFLPEDRDRMTDLVQNLSRPVVHYKVMAAGRNDPREAFAYAARKIRPQDAVCVGIYNADNPDMLAEDVRLFAEAVRDATPAQAGSCGAGWASRADRPGLAGH